MGNKLIILFCQYGSWNNNLNIVIPFATHPVEHSRWMIEMWLQTGKMIATRKKLKLSGENISEFHFVPPTSQKRHHERWNGISPSPGGDRSATNTWLGTQRQGRRNRVCVQGLCFWGNLKVKREKILCFSCRKIRKNCTNRVTRNVTKNRLRQLYKYRGADKSLARPGRKEATATEDFEFHISYL